MPFSATSIIPNVCNVWLNVWLQPLNCHKKTDFFSETPVEESTKSEEKKASSAEDNSSSDDSDSDDDDASNASSTSELLKRAKEESRNDSPNMTPRSDSPFNFIEDLKDKLAHIPGHKPEEVDQGKQNFKKFF